MLILSVLIVLIILVGGLFLSNEIQQLKKETKEINEQVQSLQSVVDVELQRVEEAMDDLFLKREEDLKRFNNMPLAEKARSARTKFNKKK